MSDSRLYINRTVDLLAYQAENVAGEQLTVQSLHGDGVHSGRITTGIQKLAQRFTLELLTEAGSIKYNPTRGCDFITTLRAGGIQSQIDLFVAFSSALVDIKRNLQAEELETDPDDEKYDSAEILNVTFSPGQAAVYVKINSVAGDSRTVIAPINTVI